MPDQLHDDVTLSAIQRHLGVEFNDLSLLNAALTHKSYLNEHPMYGRGRGMAPESYERLEFLGDAVLNVSVARRLFEAMPGADEGTLTLGRSHVVCRDSLSAVAHDIGIGQWVVFGMSESDAKVRKSVLEDVYESLLGAVFVDQGATAAEEFISWTLGESIRDVVDNGVEKNAKSRFQELVQAFGLPTPVYVTRPVHGTGRPNVYESTVSVSRRVVATSTGSGKTTAEMMAAEAGLSRFQDGVPQELGGKSRRLRTQRRPLPFSRTRYPRRRLDLQSNPEPVARAEERGPLRRIWLRLSAALLPARIQLFR